MVNLTRMHKDRMHIIDKMELPVRLTIVGQIMRTTKSRQRDTKILTQIFSLIKKLNFRYLFNHSNYFYNLS
jgi:hypothetical protein